MRQRKEKASEKFSCVMKGKTADKKCHASKKGKTADRVSCVRNLYITER